MPDHVEETVEKLAELHQRHWERSSWAQRAANRFTMALGHPGAIAVVVAVVVAWILGNLSASRFHLHPLEAQPFPDLALGLGFMAVVVALLILSTQRHGEQLAERRAELTLQIALVSELKIAKVIALLEEQRAENPMLTSRRDPEAEHMAAPADTSDALSRIEDARPNR